MKKIVLLGDSIRHIGYGYKVPNLLGDEYTVWQPGENCCYSIYTFFKLRDWKDKIAGADVIHWNNGIWDISDAFGDGRSVAIDVYADYIFRIAKLLKGLGKEVIFALTTPVRPDKGDITNELVCEYNARVRRGLEELGVHINDLYTPLAEDVEKYICDDKLHLSEEGKDKAAELVAGAIRSLCE